MKRIGKIAKAHGWTITRTASGHLEFRSPTTPATARADVTHSGTPSDWRAIMNLAAELRRAGLPIPHKGHTPKKAR